MVILPCSVFLCFFFQLCVCVCSDIHTADLGPQARVEVGPVNIAELVSVKVFIFCVSVS